MFDVNEISRATIDAVAGKLTRQVVELLDQIPECFPSSESFEPQNRPFFRADSGKFAEFRLPSFSMVIPIQAPTPVTGCMSLKKDYRSWMSLKSPCATRASAGVVILLLFASFRLLSDQIQMQNGDRYVGHVLSLTNDILIVQSEVLGTIRLPRASVAAISLAPVSATNSLPVAIPIRRPQALKVPAGKTEPNFAAALREMQSDTNSLRQVQKQFLAEAPPEANKKFNEMAQSLMTGQMSLSDLRAQAATAAEQLRSLKSQGGDEIGSSLDGYLAILESFLKETPAPPGSATNRITPVTKPPATSREDE